MAHGCYVDDRGSAALVTVIVLVEEHSLVQLQFKLVANIYAESHVGFSLNSRRLLKEI